MTRLHADDEQIDNTLVLPAPLDVATASCGTIYGRRCITWTVLTTGVLHRNIYEAAWFEIAERQPWRGEPLSLWAQRRTPGDTWSRTPFTDHARDALASEVLPPVARYGFSRLWVDLHRRKPTGDLHQAVHRAERELEWRRQAAELAGLHADGLAEFVALPLALRREPRVAVVERYRGDSPSAAVVARAVVAGEHGGWMTDDGRLIPTEDVLRDPAVPHPGEVS